MQHAVQRAVLNHGNLSGERREAVPGVASPAPSLALAGGNLVTRDRSRRIFPTCTRDTTRIWLNRQCLQGSVLPRQKESERSTGRRSFVSAQGLIALLFKTARSQTPGSENFALLYISQGHPPAVPVFISVLGVSARLVKKPLGTCSRQAALFLVPCPGPVESRGGDEGWNLLGG